MPDSEPDDPGLEGWTRRYPPLGLTPEAFERFVADLFDGPGRHLANYRVTLHDRIQAADGTYDFDATVRFKFKGLEFLVLLEAKAHQHPIKRELVQILAAKKESVGAHKAVMVATAHYQRGAINYAKARGIALATVIDGSLTYETRSALPSAPLTADRARELGLPLIVAMFIERGDSPTSTRISNVSPDQHDMVTELALGMNLDDRKDDES